MPLNNTPGLAMALLGMLLADAQAGARTGPTSAAELFECGHKRRANYLDASLAAVGAEIQGRLRALGRPDAVILAERPFLTDLLERIEKDRKVGHLAEERRGVQVGPEREVSVADDADGQSRHQAFSDAAPAEPGSVTAQVARPLDTPMSPAQDEAATELGRSLGLAAAAILRRLNDDLPPGFVAHVTLSRKDH